MRCGWVAGSTWLNTGKPNAANPPGPVPMAEFSCLPRPRATRSHAAATGWSGYRALACCGWWPGTQQQRTPLTRKPQGLAFAQQADVVTQRAQRVWAGRGRAAGTRVWRMWAAGVHAAGNRRQKRVCSVVDANDTVPPCASMMARVIARPKPVPSGLRCARDLSTR